MAALRDSEAMKLTGTRGAFTREQVLMHLERFVGADDRADFAILDEPDTYIGEVVLNEPDEDNLAVNYRIALASSSARGRGHGTEAGRAAVEWAFGAAACTASRWTCTASIPAPGAPTRRSAPGRGARTPHAPVG